MARILRGFFMQTRMETFCGFPALPVTVTIYAWVTPVPSYSLFPVYHPEAGAANTREPLINLTLISGSLLFFSFSCGKLRKINNNVALIYSRLNKSVLP